MASISMICSGNPLPVHEGAGGVKQHFTSRYRYILVDETQDTDKIQLDIVKSILGSLEDSQDRLFVVGDPKQSIYFFRAVRCVPFQIFTRDYIIEELKGTLLFHWT